MASMIFSWQRWLAVAGGAGLLLVGGCQSAPPPQASHPPANTNAAVLQVEAETARRAQDQEQASEQRTQAHAHYATGLIYELNQRPQEALDQFFNAALGDPAYEELVLDVARQLLQTKKPEKAVQLLAKSAARPNATGAIFAWLGVAYSQMNKNEQAMPALRAALKKDPLQMVAYQNLVKIYFQNGQPRQGVKALLEAAQQSTDQPAFYLDLVDLLNTFRSLAGKESELLKKRAIETLKKAEALKPQDLYLRLRLGESFNNLGDLNKASELYAQLLKENPSLPALKEKLADVYLRNNDKKGATELLEAMVRQNASDPQAHYLLGVLASESKDFNKAAEYFSKTILLNPSFEPAYFDLAGMQIAADQPQAALETLEKIRQIVPQSFLVEFYSSLAYSRMKKYPEALSRLTRAEVIATASETNRLNHALFFQLGAVYERTGDYAQAEKYFRRCLEKSPEDAEALNYLGYMWAERGENLAEARELIEKAVKLEPKNAAFLDSYAWVLFKLKQPKEALPCLLRSLELSTEPDATLMDHLGDIYEALNQPDKARDAWQKSLGIEPNETIRKKLEKHR